MPVSRAENGRWRYRANVKTHDGTTIRISGSAPVQNNTKAAAVQAERDHVARVQASSKADDKKAVPTFKEWFNGRFWTEWVIAQDNKPAEREAKQSIFKHHLAPAFGDVPLDAIKVAEINRFRATLLEKQLSRKRINNILAVLSKALRYADDVELIKAPRKIGLLKVERPEIECWDLEQYARILDAARREGPAAYAGVCLAGEAGLRVGEVKALRWREDVDLVARTITVNQQMRRGALGTPKGRTRRTVAMTDTLYEALRALPVVREGYVVLDHVRLGHHKHEENAVKWLMKKICRRAGLPEAGWHRLRHSFGSHAAMFGVNPWRLMTWMGHKRIDETMLYVHLAEQHRRDLPPALVAVGTREMDPDKRILAMLGARSAISWQQRANESEKPAEIRMISAG